MELKTLKEIEERLALIDGDIEAADKEERVAELATEKKELVNKQAELKAIEERKKTAMDIVADKIDTPKVEVRTNIIKANFESMSPEEVRGTEEYRSSYFKRLMGRTLTDVEKRANEMGTTDVAGVIPTMTQDRIFNKLKEYAPLLSEVTLFQVPGNVTVAVEGTNNAAAIHTQNAAITPAADTMTSVTLGGFEIVKVLRISKTVEKMAIPAFESWLVDYLAEGISAKVGSYIIYGSGSSQPKGIDYAATWTNDTNAVDWGSTSTTPAELVELVGYLKAGYHRRAKWLMNSQTFFSQIVAPQDNSKYKILTDDYRRLLGYPVMLDDNCAAGDIFFGDFKKVIANLSQNITVDKSADSGFLNNAIDYRGSTIFDCDIAVGEAFVKSAADLTAGA